MTDTVGSKAPGRKKNPEECPYGFSLTALGHHLQRSQPTQTCSDTWLRFWRVFQVLAPQMSLQGAAAFKLYPDNFTTAVVCRTLRSRVYVFEPKHPTGTLLFPFISSSVNCRMVFQRPGKWDRHVNVMKQWRLYCRLVWEWVERWGYVFSMAACRNGFNDNNSSEHNSIKAAGCLEWRILLSYRQAEWKIKIKHGIHS